MHITQKQAFAIKEFIGYIDAGTLWIVTSQEYDGPPFFLALRQIIAGLADANAPAEEAELAIYCDDLVKKVTLIIHHDGPDVTIFAANYGDEESKSWLFSELQSTIVNTHRPAASF